MSRAPLQSLHSNQAAGRMSLGPARQMKPTSSARQSMGPGVRRSSRNPSASRQSLTRQSMGPGARRSTTSRTDPRPINNKAYMTDSIHLLIEFLTSHDYHRPISPQTLSQPNNKEYFAIVNFLYHQYDPSFVWSKKKADEDIVVEIFKLLKYPSAINKSYLKSVGSLHCWPSLLAALKWLVELLMHQEEVAAIEDEEEMNETGDKLFFNHLERGYKTFLYGDDTAMELEGELAKHFAVRNEQIERETQDLLRENAAAEKDINALIVAGEELPTLEQRKADFVSDVGKFNSLVEQLEVHRTKIDSIRSDVAAELAEKETSLKALEKESETVKRQIDNQELDISEVDRMTKERATLDADLASVQQMKDRNEQQRWELEMRMSKFVESIDKNIIGYNSMAQRLKIVPITAKYAKGKNYEMHFNVNGSSQKDILGLDIKNEIRPLISSLRDQFSQSQIEADEEQFNLQDKLMRAEEECGDMREEVNAAEGLLRKAEEIYKIKKEKAGDFLKQLEAEADDLQREATETKLDDEAMLDKSVRQLERMMEKYNDLETRCDTEKQEFSTLIANTLNLLMNHKHYVQETLEALKLHLETEKAEMEKMGVSASN